MATEAELRAELEGLYDVFGEEYRKMAFAVPELHIVDDRIYTESKNRYLDLVVRNGANGSLIPIEYKRGILSEQMIVECVFRRGYLELCHKQLPNFTTFIFVAQAVDVAAKKLCEQITQQNDCGTKVLTHTYDSMAQGMVRNYIKWANSRQPKGKTIKVIAACAELLPLWLTEDWLESTTESLFGG